MLALYDQIATAIREKRERPDWDGRIPAPDLE